MARLESVRFQVDPLSSLSPGAQIHEQLLNYVHLGLLTPESRLPTVRELAAQARVNLKTAFRIYRRLARDDLVNIRPQRGVFVKFSARAAQRSRHSRLGVFLRRLLREGRHYNLSPVRLSQLLAAETRWGPAQRLRCAFLECNREQTDLFSEELKRRLNLDVFPVLTNSLPRRREQALRRADVFITTDFHWQEARRWAAQHHKELYCIRLNPAFHRMLVRNARRGFFPMILTDVSFESSFRRAIAATAAPEVIDRLVFVHYRKHRLLRRLLSQARSAYVSPLCEKEVARQMPRRVRLVTLRDMISRKSLQALRRSLRLQP